jgi:hypothetical protein
MSRADERDCQSRADCQSAPQRDNWRAEFYLMPPAFFFI